jgi:hypothetical protein
VTGEERKNDTSYKENIPVRPIWSYKRGEVWDSSTHFLRTTLGMSISFVMRALKGMNLAMSILQGVKGPVRTNWGMLRRRTAKEHNTTIQKGLCDWCELGPDVCRYNFFFCAGLWDWEFFFTHDALNSVFCLLWQQCTMDDEEYDNICKYLKCQICPDEEKFTKGEKAKQNRKNFKRKTKVWSVRRMFLCSYFFYLLSFFSVNYLIFM